MKYSAFLIVESIRDGGKPASDLLYHILTIEIAHAHGKRGKVVAIDETSSQDVDDADDCDDCDDDDDRSLKKKRFQELTSHNFAQTPASSSSARTWCK